MGESAIKQDKEEKSQAGQKKPGDGGSLVVVDFVGEALLEDRWKSRKMQSDGEEGDEALDRGQRKNREAKGEIKVGSLAGHGKIGLGVWNVRLDSPLFLLDRRKREADNGGMMNWSEKILRGRWFLLLVPFVFCGTACAEDNPIFESLKGKWKGDGELHTESGEVIRIHEDWEGKMIDDGKFRMAGKRDWNDEKQEFSWVFTFNSSTDLYECEYRQSGMDEPMKFEVSISGENRVELKTPFGEPGGELIITNVVESKDRIEGTVELKKRDGLDSFQGKVVHQRAEEK